MSRKSTTAKGSRAYTMTRMSYKDIMKLIDKHGMAAFRKVYTAQRDIVHKQLMRLSKSSGTKATIGREGLYGYGPTGAGKIEKLSDLDRQIKEKGLNELQAKKLLANALSNINSMYFSKRHSLKGWEQTIKKIQKTMKEAGYGNVTKHHLELMGELMARVYAIYGRRNPPSETVFEAIMEGYGEEMMKMTDEQLAVFLSKWDERNNLELYS